MIINEIIFVTPSNSLKNLNFTSAAVAVAAAAASASAAKTFRLLFKRGETLTQLLRTRLIAAMSVPSRLAALRHFMKVVSPLGSSDDGGILRATKKAKKEKEKEKAKAKEKERPERNVSAFKLSKFQFSYPSHVTTMHRPTTSPPSSWAATTLTKANTWHKYSPPQP